MAFRPDNRRVTVRRLRKGIASLVALCAVLACALPGTASATPTVQVFTDQLVSAAPWLGLGVQLDPYDTLKPTQVNWSLIEQRLSFMSPGLIRVVEPEYDYFAGYDASGNPTYKWTSYKVQELLTILAYAKAHGITVVLGDWENPIVGGDARIPAEFLGALHDQYGFTNLRYYNLMNEPNDEVPSLSFSSWAGLMRSMQAEIDKLGYQSWLQLVGPDNENSWDDDQPAFDRDRSVGLDSDNPLGGDSWVTDTLRTIPSLIGAYDSHRYATVWGVENGVYGDQVRSRREEISNLDSGTKPYFDGEAGMTALQSTPFAADTARVVKITADLARELDPSTIVRNAANPVASAAAAGTDSQPNIASYQYGVWMGDMMIQAINAGLSGASAWDFDDAMHNGGGYGALNLKRWGFFNSLAGQDGYPASDINLRPWYFSWSTLSRAFPPGSQPLVLPSTGVAGLRVAAARIPDGSRYYLSIAVVNDSSAAHSIVIKVPSVTGSVTFGRYDYVPGVQKVDEYGLPLTSSVFSAKLSAGVSLSLPGNALVVLTSRGFGSSVSPSQGTGTVTDNLHSLSVGYEHSPNLVIVRKDPAEFNYAPARATPKGKKGPDASIAYRASEISSFELKTYFEKQILVTAYVSEEGSGWWRIPLSHTAPSPTVGGHEQLVEFFSALPMPAGINRLKVVLGHGTQLAGVRIASDRSGPACLATELPASAGSLAGIAPGISAAQVLGTIGRSTTHSGSAWQFCVNRGGELGVAYGAHATVAAVVSTAPAFRPEGFRIGESSADVEARLGPTRIAGAGHGLIAATDGLVFVIHAGAVQALALADPALLPHLGQLAGTIHRAGVT